MKPGKQSRRRQSAGSGEQSELLSAWDLCYLTLSRGKECNQERIDIDGRRQSTNGKEKRGEIEKMVR